MRFGMGDIPIDKLSQNQPGVVANSGCICSVNISKSKVKPNMNIPGELHQPIHKEHKFKAIY